MLTADPCEHHSTREEADDDTHMRSDRCGSIGRKVCGEAMQSIRAAYKPVIPISVYNNAANSNGRSIRVGLLILPMMFGRNADKILAKCSNSIAKNELF